MTRQILFNSLRPGIFIHVGHDILKEVCCRALFIVFSKRLLFCTILLYITMLISENLPICSWSFKAHKYAVRIVMSCYEGILVDGLYIQATVIGLHLGMLLALRKNTYTFPGQSEITIFTCIAWIRAVRHRTTVPHSSYHLLCMLEWSLSGHCSLCINHSAQNIKGWLRKTLNRRHFHLN